jgi:hypothetical protein
MNIVAPSNNHRKSLSAVIQSLARCGVIGVTCDTDKDQRERPQSLTLGYDVRFEV